MKLCFEFESTLTSFIEMRHTRPKYIVVKVNRTRGSRTKEKVHAQ